MNVASEPFSKLTPYLPRKFVPSDIDLGDWAAVSPLFDALEQRGASLASSQELERWALDCSELLSAIGEEGARRHILMTCQTDDAEREKRFLHFIENIAPRLKPRAFRLAQLFVESPYANSLPKQRYFVLLRSLRNEVDLFREENVPLETELAKLGQQYQKTIGAMTAQFQGREMTLTQMGKFLEEPDRALRQEAWEKSAARRLQDKDKLDDIFDEMLKLRVQCAKNAGFFNYRDYAFKLRERFDYTPDDCFEFHASIEKHIVPLLRDLDRQRAKTMGLGVAARLRNADKFEQRSALHSSAAATDVLRPWDLSVDPQNRPPLRPFDEVETLINKTQAIFDQMHPELADGFSLMREHGLLDLQNRKGKAPGGYQSTLDESRVPFIFMNAVGVQRDVVTLLHEAGHAFHALATRDEPLLAYRSAPIEFCEVASMGMELLAFDHISQFYSDADARRARREHLEGIIRTFPWIALVDAFQHWLYTKPAHTREERRTQWGRLMDRFGSVEDWSGYEQARAHWWHKQLHIFLYPFYYIEYGIAQLGALQLWQTAKNDPRAALQNYRRALALGGSKPLPELFAAAGLKFDFSENTVGALTDAVRKELSQ
jgi:oligoendopeptidase F